MELYTLDENFLRKGLIEPWESAIWTERYSTEGDFKLTLAATPENIALLPEGTYVGNPESDEVMIVETQSIQDHILTVSGPSLLSVLKHRIYWEIDDLNAEPNKLFNLPPENIISDIINRRVAGTGSYPSPDSIIYGLDKQHIPQLSYGTVSGSGIFLVTAVPFGNLWESIKSLLEASSLGINIKLLSATLAGFQLKYNIYSGRDLTSTQSTYPVVQFSPAMDSLTNIKELRSIAGYKNVAYAQAPNWVDPMSVGWLRPIGVAYATPADETVVGFKRRVLFTNVDDIKNDVDGRTNAELQAILNQRAKDALANNNYTRVVDGEVVPQSEYQYGTHFKMGDIVELKAADNQLQRARITEYIRSADTNGERNYPTVSVMN